MRIQVQTLTGIRANFEVEQSTTISELNNLVEGVFSVPSDEQKLLFNGKLLESGSVGDYQINADAAIYMLVAIEGGKGKKKKKKTKKPKKPHKKKKVKLAILNYFKVDDGKVVRLRQRSPAGTFMAEHQDRYYCGRTHITYKKKEDSKKVEKTEKADKGAAKEVKEVAPAKGKGKGKN